MFENKRFKDGTKRKLTPYLRKLCHEFIQNFHQIESTKGKKNNTGNAKGSADGQTEEDCNGLQFGF